MAIFKIQAPKVSFSLRNVPDKQGRKALYIKLFIDGKYVMKSTDIWLRPDQWDPSAQLVVNSRQAGNLNASLSDIKEKVETLILEKYGENVNADDIRDVLNGKDPKKGGHKDFFSYAREVNQSYYDKGKFGYRSFYAKGKNIDAFEKFVHDKLGMPTLFLDGLSVSYFDKYIAYRLNVRKNKSREGINKTLVPLYEAIKYAVKSGDLDISVANPIIDNYISVRETDYGMAINESGIKYLTEEQMSKLAEFWRSLRKGSRRDALDMFFFSYYSCGLRVSDLVTLEWRNIDFDKKEINKVQVKTKKSPAVIIPLPDQGIEILKRWKGKNPKYVFDWLPEKFDMKDQALLALKINSCDRVVNGHLHRTSTELEFPMKLTIHMARHTFAVIALNKGLDVYMISKLLGHSSIIATEKTYAEFMKDKVDSDAQKILEMEF